MEKGAVVLVFALLAFLFSSTSILLRVLFRDKKVEDARQRQREAEDAEMWARIDAACEGENEDN